MKRSLQRFSDNGREIYGDILPLPGVMNLLLSFFRHFSHQSCIARRCLAATMWGHENMNMLSLLPVLMLGIVMIWFVWPMVADPIHRRLAARTDERRDARGDDLFRALAKHAEPKHDLFQADRG